MRRFLEFFAANKDGNGLVGAGGTPRVNRLAGAPLFSFTVEQQDKPDGLFAPVNAIGITATQLASEIGIILKDELVAEVRVRESELTLIMPDDKVFTVRISKA